MPRHGGNSLDVHAVLEVQGGKDMAEIVEPKVLQSSAFRIRWWRVETESG